MEQSFTYSTPRKVTKPVENNKAEELRNILKDYAKPDPSIIQQLPKGGTKLDFVGHADITRILIEIDPYWSWEPCGWVQGRPAIHVENGMATMWGWLTVHGKELLGVGSVKADKGDYEKELIGDFLRNASMRFGISLNLWTKNQWADLDGDKPVSKPQAAPQDKPKATALPDDASLTEEQINAFNKACVDNDLNPMTIYKDASVRFGFATQKDLAALRKAFTAAKAGK
jgi:hypothetical protein